MKNNTGIKISSLFLVMILLVILSACGPAATPTQDVSQIQTQSVQTAMAEQTLNAPAPTLAPPPGPTPNPSIPVAVVPTPAANEPAAVANYNTAIFSGPGTQYVVYGAFLGGATAKVVGKSEDGLWWAVSVPVAPTGNGWVSAGWVTVSNADNVPVLPTPPVPPTIEIVAPLPDEPQGMTLANVYVRTGPAENYPAYGIVPAGINGRIIGISEDSLYWVVRIDPAIVGNGYGWMRAEYIAASNTAGMTVVATPPLTTTEAPPAPPAGVPTGTATDYLNVRSGPGTNYPVLVVAPPGASGYITGKSSDSQWWQVKISTQYAADGLGWVSGGYVITQNVEGVPVVAAPPAPPVVGTTPPTTSMLGCALVSQSPVDGTVVTISSPFETTWVLQNTGTQKWAQNDYDFVLVGGANGVTLRTGPDRYDLANDVEPGATYSFTVPMMAPFGPGQFGEMWQMASASTAVCQFYVYIEVQ